MPRKNRQKLHRALRLRAEAHRARVRAEKAAERAERARRAAIEARPREAPPAERPVRAEVWASIAQLLALGGSPPGDRLRVRKLFEAVSRELPGECTAGNLPWLQLLAGPEWRRSPADFRAPGGDARALRDAFAAHLFVKWPVPAFLFRALDVAPLAVARAPVEDRWAVGVLAGVGAGRSPRDLPIDAPLTRAMWHAFLSADPGTLPIHALRDAQVAGFGGSGLLAAKLRATLLGVHRGGDRKLGEPFWHGVIGWLARAPWAAGLPVAELADVLRWVEACQWTHDAPLVLSGRTEGSVRRAVEAWRLRAEAAGRPPFLPSGIPPWSDGGWSARELPDEAALVAEGQLLKHCVGHYAELVRSRKVAIFSLRRDDDPVATVEVALGPRRIVQAKGAYNRGLTVAELGVLRAFAASAQLAIALAER